MKLTMLHNSDRSIVTLTPGQTGKFFVITSDGETSFLRAGPLTQADAYATFIKDTSLSPLIIEGLVEF